MDILTSLDQCAHVKTEANVNERYSSLKEDVHKRVQRIHARLERHGVHSSITMASAGFKYTGEGDTVRCDTCQVEVAGWTEDMVPISIHSERSPDCQFIRSRLAKPSVDVDDQENPAKRQKIESCSDQCEHNGRLVEVKLLKEIRRRTYSHWPIRIKPSAEQMIAAGFFACNVGDRVICLYCNLICQQWTPDTDDPSKVHETLSPQCLYVLSMLKHPNLSPTLILNGISSNNQTCTANGATIQHRFDQIVHTASCHPPYNNIIKRLESFTTWSHESSPSVEALSRAGFFYTGTGTIITCFYCNGSLQNWGANDDPVVEHARWFSHCAYAKQLCGDELYHKIQEAKRVRQERDRVVRSNETNPNNNLPAPNQRQLPVHDTTMLSRYVAARLDLPMSQSLLDQNFKLSVIKRCWEDQLKLKHDDFVSGSDLFMACTILQKQIDHIQGDKKNIIIPSVQMKLIREGKQSEVSSSSERSTVDDAEAMQTQTPPATSTIAPTGPKQNSEVLETNSANTAVVSNPCVICYQEEKRLACIPCGHFTACVPCSHSLRTCPVCRKEIEAFVRIYV